MKLIGFDRPLGGGLLVVNLAASEAELDALGVLIRRKVTELPGPEDPAVADDSNVRSWMDELGRAKAERDDAQSRRLGAEKRLATAGSGTPAAAVATIDAREMAGQDFARSQARVKELERCLGQARQELSQRQRDASEAADQAYREMLRARLLPLHEQLAAELLRGALPDAVAILVALGRLGPPS
jgi:hypothetical protein